MARASVASLQVPSRVPSVAPSRAALGGSVWRQRVSALLVACGVLVGVAGCGEPVAKNATGTSNENNSAPSIGSPTQQRDPDRIYANHTEGVDPHEEVRDLQSMEDYREGLATFEKWGVQQTPDWLEICNQVNVPGLRKAGFDPQKNLDNRRGSRHLYNCSWSVDKGRLHLMFGPTDPVEKIISDPDFRYSHTVERKGETYYMGRLSLAGEGTVAKRFTCSLIFERKGQTYTAVFTGKEQKTHEQACEELINMVVPED